MAQKKIKRHPGAIKANRQSLRRQSRNRAIKKGIRLATRAVFDSKDPAKSAELASAAVSALDKAAKRGTIHWKTAARRKARIARRIAAPQAAAPAAA